MKLLQKDISGNLFSIVLKEKSKQDTLWTMFLTPFQKFIQSRRVKVNLLEIIQIKMNENSWFFQEYIAYQYLKYVSFGRHLIAPNAFKNFAI